MLNGSYADLAFPFEEIVVPAFHIEMHWNYDDYLSYLNTWSAVKKYSELYGENPVEAFVIPKIDHAWPDKDKSRLVTFPLTVRVGRMLC